MEKGLTESQDSKDGFAEGAGDTINSAFNAELERQINKTLPKGHIYKLGNAGGILQSAGLPDLPIELNADRLALKASDGYGHPFNIAEIKDLPKHINEPIAVFSYGDKTKSVNVITEITKDGKNFLVGIALNPQVGNKRLKINSIRTIFPKDTQEWVAWIEQGKSLYLNKEKVLKLLNNRRNPADVDSDPSTAHTINIVKNFENVKKKDENLFEPSGDGTYDTP